MRGDEMRWAELLSVLVSFFKDRLHAPLYIIIWRFGGGCSLF